MKRVVVRPCAALPALPIPSISSLRERIRAVDSVPIQTAVEMGLLPLLERLARRAHELNDPELEKVLDILAL